VFKESLSFYVDGVAVGTNIVIADICGQTAGTDKGFFMEFAFEYSYVPKLLDELLRSGHITINDLFHLRIPRCLA
jgi:hypothetical protein